MSKEIGSRVRYGEAFWRAHHEAWQQSALNQCSNFPEIALIKPWLSTSLHNLVAHLPN